jgi:hypothetical protein
MKRLNIILLTLLFFAGDGFSQVPDDGHEKCKDARDYVGCIRVLTGTTVSKEKAEIEEINNLKKSLALLPSRLQSVSPTEFSVALRPFTDALAAAKAAEEGSTYSLEEKNKILEITNPTLRLNEAIEIFRSTSNNRVVLESEAEVLYLPCSKFDSYIHSFNKLMESNVLDYPNFIMRIISDEHCATDSYRNLEEQMRFYIIDASKSILKSDNFPKYSNHYKDLGTLKAEWYESNRYDFSEYKSRSSKYSNKYMRNEEDKTMSTNSTARTNRAITKIYILEEPTIEKIKKMDKLLIKFQKRGYIGNQGAYNCMIDTQNRMYLSRLAKFYFDTKEGSRESNLLKVEELSLNLLASNWGPHLLSYESCKTFSLKGVGQRWKDEGKLCDSVCDDSTKSIYESRLGWVNQALHLLAKVEKETVLNSQK